MIFSYHEHDLAYQDLLHIDIFISVVYLEVVKCSSNVQP